MADFKISSTGLLINNNRVFLPSRSINIFPCSRRGQSSIEDAAVNGTAKYYDPEARLNTERTNRLRTATNGFKDSFIVKFNDENNDGTGSLTFALAGYLIEVKEFNLSNIIDEFENRRGTLYAHLSLHDGISLDVEDYFTEILYRQSNSATPYLDVRYSDSTSQDDFFVGVSFTTVKEITDTIQVENEDPEAESKLKDKVLAAYKLPLFTFSKTAIETETTTETAYDWELIQASLLPKIEHGETEDSIKINGDFTVEHPVLNEDGTPVLDTDGKPETQVSFKVTKDETLFGPTVMSSLIVGEKADDEGFPEGTIKVKEHIETPTLEATSSIKTPILYVKSIENNIDDANVISINDNLNVTTGHIVAVDTLNVNTINSRQENGTITVESLVTLNGNATLNKNLTVEGDLDTGTITATNLVKTPTLNVNSITSDSDEVELNKPINVTGKATLDNGLEVTSGDAIIGSNLNVDDNINVGTPTTPANTNNSGYIVAKKDITAEQDLIAKRDIKVTKKATIESLVVGERISTDSTEAGTITAKKLIKTQALEATTVDVDSITSDATDGLRINPKTKINNTLEVTGKATLNNGLEVTNGESSLQKLSAKETKLESLAIAGEAASGSALTVNGKTTVNNDLEVTGTTSAPTLKVDTVTTNANSEITIESSLKVTSKATLTDELEVTKKATLNNGLKVANGDTDIQKLTATEVSADTIIQNGNRVPVITLEQISTEEPEIWQLQIAHVIKKPKN